MKGIDMRRTCCNPRWSLPLETTSPVLIGVSAAAATTSGVPQDGSGDNDDDESDESARNARRTVPSPARHM